MAEEPIRTLEIERKYDVEAGTPLPAWTNIRLIASVGEAEPRELDARYLDTAGRDLARSGIALRRRSGGPDEGWHVKISTLEGKREVRWPLDADPLDTDPVVPEAILAALAQLSPGPFLPIARIRNSRTAYSLRDAAGNEVAEFVDDRVRAVNIATGGQDEWREWEVELGPAAPVDAIGREIFFAEVDAAVAAVGGNFSASGSKLGRALSA